MRKAVILLLCACSLTAASARSRSGSPGAEITIAVFDYADVAKVLPTALSEATRILTRTGVVPVWVLCPGSPAEITANPVCNREPAPGDVVLHILPRASSRLSNDTSAFGFAVPPQERWSAAFAGVYFDSIQQLSREHRTLAAPVFGAVIAHEIGHLLLGPGAHSRAGIMSPHWGREELKQVQQGLLIFAGSQAKQIRSNILNRSVTTRD
jgi:hypothetical protein